MTSTHLNENMVERIATYACTQTMYLNRTDSDDVPVYMVMSSFISEKVRRGEWTMASTKGSASMMRLFPGQRESTAGYEWSTCIFYGGPDMIRVVLMERRLIAMDIWRRVTLMVAGDARLQTPMALARIVAATSRSGGTKLNRLTNELMTHSEPTRWLTQFIDTALIGRALDLINLRYPKLRPFESDVRPPIALPQLPETVPMPPKIVASKVSPAAPPPPPPDHSNGVLSSESSASFSSSSSTSSSASSAMASGTSRRKRKRGRKNGVLHASASVTIDESHDQSGLGSQSMTAMSGIDSVILDDDGGGTQSGDDSSSGGDDIDAAITSAMVTDVRGMSRRRLPPTVPIYATYTRPIRALLVGRLLAEYCVARPYQSRATVAGQLTGDVVEQFRPGDAKQVAQQLGQSSISELIVRANSASARQQQTPAMCDTTATPENVQRFYEMAVVMAQRMRQSVDSANAWWLPRRGGRLVRMLAHCVNFLMFNDVPEYRGDLYELVDHWGDSAEHNQTDVRVFAETIIRLATPLPSLLRYQQVRWRRSRTRLLASVFVSTGIERALAMARRLDMPLQIEALKRIHGPSSQRRYLTVVPLQSADSWEGCQLPSPLELATMVRTVAPTAREGIDFVVVWSPANAEQYALVVRRAVAESLVHGTTTGTLLSNSRAPTGNRGDTVARTLIEYGNGRLSWRAVAHVLAAVARTIMQRSGVRASDYESADHVQKIIARCERVLATMCTSTRQLVSLVYMMLLGRRQSFFNLMALLLTPRADNVFMCMRAQDTRESVPLFLQRTQTGRRLWASFFEEATGDTVRARQLAGRYNSSRPVIPLASISAEDEDGDGFDGAGGGGSFGTDTVHGEIDEDAFSATELAVIRRRCEALRNGNPSDVREGAVGVHGFSFTPESIGHRTSKLNARVRPASRRACEEQNGQLHLDIIDTVLESPTFNLRTFASFARELMVVERAPREATLFTAPSPASLNVQPERLHVGHADASREASERILKDFSSLESVRRELDAMDQQRPVSLALMMRVWTAVSDVLATYATSESSAGMVRPEDVGSERDQRLNLAMTYVQRVLSKDPVYGMNMFAFEQSTFIGTRYSCGSEGERVSDDTMPRVLSVAQPFLVDGTMTNFFYSLAS